MKTVVRVCTRRSAVVVVLGLLIGVTGFDGIRGQEGGMRWDGVIEHLTGPNDGWGYPDGAARLSRHPMSRDARWVVFSADVPNAEPFPPTSLLFRRDRMTGESQAVFGAAVLNPPVISSDGNHIAFQACEEWWRADQAAICDVYIVDFRYWSFVNASTTVDGTLSDAASDDPVLSADGRYLVFRTRSTTLLPPGAAPGQLVLRDRDGNGNGTFDEPGEVTLEVVSVSATGTAGNAESGSAEVSADGRFVAFRSRASNLVPGDTNNAWDVFLRDRVTGDTERINVGWDGQQATPTVDSPAISMSANGDVIAFATDDAYLTNPPQWNQDFNNALDVVVYERSSNSLTRIDIGRNGELGNGHTYWPTLSESGQYVSLVSTATNVDVPVMLDRARVYVYDRFARRATRVDLTPSGVEPNQDSVSPVISGDGSFVAFVSAAANLTSGQAPPPDAIYGAAHFAVTPETLTIPASGGEVTATITAQAYVKWSSDTFSPWLNWVNPPWGTGSGSVSMSAYPNLDPAPRTETVRFLGKTVVVTQEAGLSATGVSPASGPMSGGTVVTISGTGFEPDMRVYVDGLEAISEFVSFTALRVTTPAHAPGMVSIFIGTSDSRWTTLYDAFLYQDTTPPQITPFVSGTLTNGWYTSDVTIDWLIQDFDSPVTTWCPQTILGTDTNGTSFTCTASSDGGTASATTAILRRDTTPPVIQILSPGPTIYARTPVRTANYTCTDAGSGASSCVGTVAHGAAISLTPGYNVFDVVATDVAGNAGPKEVTYAVSNGACEARPFGIAAWWPFEVPYGTSGAQFSYKDVLSGIEAVGVNTDWRSGPGAVGPFAMSTANPHSYVQAGARTALARSGALTLSAWVFPTIQNSPASVIAGREGEYLIARFPDGTLRWSLATTSPGWGWVNTGHVIPMWLWSQVVVTYDGSAVRTHVNGLLVHTLAASGVIGDAAPALDDFRIGSRQEPGAPSYFVGGIDDLLLFDRALTAAEIQRVFLAGERGLCGPRSLHMTLTPNPLRVSYGTTQDMELVATLLHNSAPESGRTVTVTRNGQPIGSSVTDQNGEFRITTSVVGNWVGTSYRYEAHHQGDFYFGTAAAWQALITEKAVPVITWPAPAAVVYGTPLDAAQQNAQASTGGNFAYTPAAGAVLPAGSHTLSMAFTPWAPYNYESTSASVTLDVMRATPTVQATGGTFNYDGLPHSATGTVTGLDGAGLSPLTFTYNGSSAVPMNAGTYAVVASFAGDANYDAASATATVTIEKSTPTVSAAGGTFTYDAAPHAATGSVTGVGGASLGPLTFSYNGSPVAPVSAGSYAVVASYAGNANYNAAAGAATLTIDKATPTVSATGGTFTYDGAAHAATGSVTGLSGANLEPLTFTYNGSSDAPVNAGSYAVVASYAGDVSYHGASATTTVTIGKAAAVLQWTQPAAIVYGTALGGAQLNATSNVAGSFTYSPAAGTVLAAGTLRPLSATFTPADSANFNGASVGTAIDVPPAPLVVRANDAAKRLGEPLPVFAGTASGFVNGDSLASLSGTLGFATTATAQSAVGTYPIAPYGLSSPNYILVFVNGTLTINRGAVIVAVSTSPEPSGNNQPMTFTAMVAAAAAAAGAPGGSVRFFDGTTLLGTAALNTGSASLTTAGLDPGTRTIEARYDGDASFETGTVSSSHVIWNPNQTPVLSVTSSRNPASVGQNVTLTANVSMPSGAVAGSVQFYSGATLLATRTIVAGRAVFTTNALAPGSHAMTARYVGSGGVPPSRSPVLVQAVGAAGWRNRSTTLTLSGAPNPSTLASIVVLTANVTGSTSSMPSGSILFMLDGEVVGDPAGVAIIPVSGSTARASLALPGLAHGRRNVTATYRGDATYKGSTAQITQTVN